MSFTFAKELASKEADERMQELEITPEARRPVPPPAPRRWDNPSSAPSPSAGTTPGIFRLVSSPPAVPFPAKCRNEFCLILWGQSTGGCAKLLIGIREIVVKG